ncbi:cytoplasmic protein [Fulvivirga sp. M361]|uniref:DUF6434 domain-containing protein n=1 Tax=Fulvivirga sp. M361 TaxID=2594266 RepID=UPI00117B30DF|nr:DUF6434 domain-containing protein [Fulvivirga sp. M361]TRX60803.1 cytoplasmic protein [Fulvivirga sp. M361]
MERPTFIAIKSGEEFNQWYWSKAEMEDICKQSGLPYSGSKFELRDRIMHALDHNGEVLPRERSKKTTSNFDWSKTALSIYTIITDNVSFGPNFRNFMKSKIGKKFTCHSDFMEWIKNNSGKTLGDAIAKWAELEERKKDPAFKRSIAAHNMSGISCLKIPESS